MKKIILTLLICNFFNLINAQSVTFYTDQISYDDKTLLMKGNFGDWTNRQYVELINRTGQNVNIRTHLHHHLNFVYFVNSENTAKHNLEINIPSGGKYTLNVIAKLGTGSPIVYNDQLGFDITYQDNREVYFEINASAYFYNSTSRGGSSTSFSKPEEYGYHGEKFETIHRGKPSRWSESDLPLTVYSNHTSYGYSDEYVKIIQKAMNMWNLAGKSVGLNTNFFKLTNSRHNADVQMDWSGNVLRKWYPNEKRILGVAVSGANEIGMWPLNTYYSDYQLKIGGVGEVLVQELGHLLGPVHSEITDDLMYSTSHPHGHPDLSKIDLTDRDRDMLGWMYNQNDYYRKRK